jgi:Protein of unknown function (DUF3500)
MRNFLAFAAATLFSLVPSAGAQQTAAATADIARDTNAFLSSLTAEQRQKVLYSFDDAQQRVRWSNFPTGFVPRGGISLRQMSPAQRDAATKLMATVLSPMGLEKVNEIREADDDFKANGSRRGPGGGRGGQPPGGPNGPPPGAQNGPPPGGGPGGPRRRPSFSSDDLFGGDLYFISFLGKPSLTDPWMLQFGGHHLALNITIVGSQGVLTPTLTGAQPATFKLNGKTIRPIGRESDQALALMQSLDVKQRSQAVLPYTVADLVLGPGQDDKRIAPEGLKASAMNATQQAVLSTWLRNGPASSTRALRIDAWLKSRQN